MIRHALMLGAATLALQAPTFRTGIEIVTVDVSVTRGDTPVHGLTSNDFVVMDNGVPQHIDSISAAQIPLSVTLVLDTSGSVAGERLASLINASQLALNELRANDSVALVTFASVVSRPVALTTNVDTARSALQLLTGAGFTTLRDAVFLALETAPHNATRPLLLVFTDGLDTSSWLSEEELLDAARRTDAVIHAISIGSQPMLKQLSHETGGRTWSASSNRDLQKLFIRAIRDMRDRYVLTYTPVGVNRPEWHALNVKLVHQNGEVVARPGYWATRSLR